MKVSSIIEMSPVLGTYGVRSLEQKAEDWLEMHPGECAAIHHFWDDGDKESVYKYFSRLIPDEKLLNAVIAVMFPQA